MNNCKVTSTTTKTFNTTFFGGGVGGGRYFSGHLYDNIDPGKMSRLLLKDYWTNPQVFKTCVHYFLFFQQMIAFQKLRKMVLISSKKLFSFSRYSNLCIFLLPSFSACWPLLSAWSKINFKAYGANNCLTFLLVDILRKKNLWHWNFVHR